MPSTIHLEVTTPEGLALSLDVSELTAPSVDGEFGVLPRHRPLLAGLRTGIIRYKASGETHAVAIGPGFAKIKDDVVSILTDRFLAKQDVDPVVARKDLKEADQAISELKNDATFDEKKALVAAVRWAAVRLELYGDPPPPTVIVALETRLLASDQFRADAIQAAPSDDGGTTTS